MSGTIVDSYFFVVNTLLCGFGLKVGLGDAQDGLQRGFGNW
jgi:hypothetical protein